MRGLRTCGDVWRQWTTGPGKARGSLSPRAPRGPGWQDARWGGCGVTGFRSQEGGRGFREQKLGAVHLGGVQHGPGQEDGSMAVSRVQELGLRLLVPVDSFRRASLGLPAPIRGDLDVPSERGPQGL